MRTADELCALDELEVALRDARAAAAFLLEAGSVSEHARLQAALFPLLQRRGLWTQAREALDSSLSLMRKVSPQPEDSVALRLLSRLHHHLATLADDQGDAAIAASSAEACLELRRRLGDPAAIADALNLMGAVHISGGSLERASECFDEALRRLPENGDPEIRGLVLHNRAFVAASSDRPDEARRCYEEALILRRAASDLRGEAATLRNLGALIHRSDADLARTYYENALRLSEALKDRHATAVLQFNLGELAEEAGDIAAAVSRYDQSRAMFTSLGSPLAEQAKSALRRVYLPPREPTYHPRRSS